MSSVLITGGAGFIGAHLAERLLRHDFEVHILDKFAAQVHGRGARFSALPETIRRQCRVVRGDVGSPAALAQALNGVDVVVHLAAVVGVGQSMYRIAGYCRGNVQGTAQLLQALLRRRRGRCGELRRLIVAGSMSVYGEGQYRCPSCGPVLVPPRPRAQLERHVWEPACRACGGRLAPSPTGEAHPPAPASIYAATKLCQEQLVLNFGQAYGVPATALRFFNVYGPRQALSNPYTGVVANLASQLLAGSPITIYEDGEQTRDFVSVHDVVAACVAALEPDHPTGIYNIGSGRSISIRQLAEALARALGRPLRLAPAGRFRVGDVRHCSADISRAQCDLGYRPQVGVAAGLAELAQWLRDGEFAPPGNSRLAGAELRAFGLGG